KKGLMSASSEVDVFLGKSRIQDQLIAEHWAIKVGDFWYEIAGTSKNDDNIDNMIEVHTDDAKYYEIRHLGKVCISRENLVQWNRRWLENHSFYAFNGDNCQLYAKHFAWEFLGINIGTQNETIGNYAVGAGVGAMIVGFLAIATGIFIKGNRH
ncbi:hypothetical protein AKO1_013513, partial [Acrasis kona]